MQFPNKQKIENINIKNIDKEEYNLNFWRKKKKQTVRPKHQYRGIFGKTEYTLNTYDKDDEDDVDDESDRESDALTKINVYRNVSDGKLKKEAITKSRECSNYLKMPVLASHPWLFASVGTHTHSHGIRIHGHTAV